MMRACWEMHDRWSVMYYSVLLPSQSNLWPLSVKCRGTKSQEDRDVGVQVGESKRQITLGLHSSDFYWALQEKMANRIYLVPNTNIAKGVWTFHVPHKVKVLKRPVQSQETNDGSCLTYDWVLSIVFGPWMLKGDFDGERSVLSSRVQMLVAANDFCWAWSDGWGDEVMHWWICEYWAMVRRWLGVQNSTKKAPKQRKKALYTQTSDVNSSCRNLCHKQWAVWGIRMPQGVSNKTTGLSI